MVTEGRCTRPLPETQRETFKSAMNDTLYFLNLFCRTKTSGNHWSFSYQFQWDYSPQCSADYLAHKVKQHSSFSLLLPELAGRIPSFRSTLIGTPPSSAHELTTAASATSHRLTRNCPCPISNVAASRSPSGATAVLHSSEEGRT